MSAQAWKDVDPEVRDLVRQATADPDSILLQPGASWDRGVRHEATLTPATTGLTPVDRELLRAYREEAAYLLRVRAYEGLLADPRLRGLFVSGLRVSTLTRLPSSTEVEQRAACVSRGEDPDAAAAVGLLAYRPTVAAQKCDGLARAALRLEPKDQPRLMLSGELLAEDRLGDAESLLADVLSSSPSAPVASAALDHVGEIQGRRGEFEAKLRSHIRAADLLPDAFQSLANALVAGVIAGQWSVAREQAARLDELLPRGSDVLVVRAATRLARGDDVIEDSGRKMLSKLQDEIGVASRQVLNGIK